MRVAIVGRDYPPRRGGLSTYAHGLVKQLEAMSVDVHLFFGGSDLRTLFIPLSSRLADFDIVHAMSPPYAAMLRHKHLVVTVAEPVVTEFPFYSISAKLKAIPGYLSELVTFHGSAYYIALSETTKTKIIKHFGISEGQISVIPGGVDSESFRVGEKGNIPPRIVLCSRLDRRKNIPEVLRALSNSTSPKEVTVIGDGPERPRLERLAQRLGVNVTFTGNISDEGLRDHLSRSEIFVTASLSEGFGLSLLEAMASGCAIVASNIGAHTELIRHLENGMIYATEEELTQMIDRLLSDPILVRRLSAAARRTALQYSWKVVSERILRLYKRLTDSSSP